MIKGRRTHGTGCTYSAAITAGLAHGKPLDKAASLAKTFVSHAIANGNYAGNHFILNYKP